MAALLAGCSGGGSEPGGRSSSADATAPVTSATAEPTYPNARPGEKPPVRPADALSGAGAEAFAVYFVKTIDWAYATMDSTLLKQASAPECALCTGFIEEFARRNSAGQKAMGSRSTILDSILSGGSDPKDQLVNVVFSATALDVVDANGVIVGSADAIPMFQMNVRVEYRAGGWIVVDATKVVTR